MVLQLWRGANSWGGTFIAHAWESAWDSFAYPYAVESEICRIYRHNMTSGGSQIGVPGSML